MPFSHNRLKNTTGIQVFSQLNKYTLYYRFLNGNVQGCVFAKNRPVSLNWTDYNYEWNLEMTSNSYQSTHPVSALGRITQGSHITFISLVYFIAFAFKGQVHVFIYRTSENCNSLVLLDKCNIEIFLSPADNNDFCYSFCNFPPTIV